MNEAAIVSARKNQKVIGQQDILDSIEKVILGPERRGRTISEREKKMTAYHEAGHALIAASLKHADPVHKVSIISRGPAGGYTLKLPTEEMRLKTKAQFVADLAVMVGGYAAEKIIFDDVSTGASNDLKEASEIARKLVTKYGMSEKLGPTTFGKNEELVFLGKEISAEKNYSEKVAAEIDEEVSGFMSRAYEAAKKIISSRRKALVAIAEALLQKEVLEQEEFNDILKPFKLKPLTI
jgi:cell division protease FtsH